MPFCKMIIFLSDAAHKILLKCMINYSFIHFHKDTSIWCPSKLLTGGIIWHVARGISLTTHLVLQMSLHCIQSSNLGPSKGQLKGCAHTSAGPARACCTPAPVIPMGPLVGVNSIFGRC